MKDKKLTSTPPQARKRLIQSLNRDLACEYRAIIATIVYSEMLKRTCYTTIAEELERHAAGEFRHAREIAEQIVSLGGIPCVMHEAGKTSTAATAMCHPDPDEDLRMLGDYRYPIHPARIPVGFLDEQAWR